MNESLFNSLHSCIPFPHASMGDIGGWRTQGFSTRGTRGTRGNTRNRGSSRQSTSVWTHSTAQRRYKHNKEHTTTTTTFISESGLRLNPAATRALSHPAPLASSAGRGRGDPYTGPPRPCPPQDNQSRSLGSRCRRRCHPGWTSREPSRPKAAACPTRARTLARQRTTGPRARRTYIFFVKGAVESQRAGRGCEKKSLPAGAAVPHLLRTSSGAMYTGVPALFSLSLIHI